MAGKAKEPDKIKQYVAAMEAKLERATGKTVAHWVRIARKCPHTRPADRLRWLKIEHGLGLARAGLVLGRAFGLSALDTPHPDDAIDRLFSGTFAPQRAVFDAVVASAGRLGRGTTRVRKGHVAFHRLKQYAALKPSRQGLLLGLALKKYPKTEKWLAAKGMGSADRIRMALVLDSPRAFNKTARALLRQAYAEA